MSLKQKNLCQNIFCHGKVWLQNSLQHLHWQVLGVAAHRKLYLGQVFFKIE
jgi:hypothetical protein